MNTYNVATLNKLNKVELNKMVQAKQATKQAFTLEALTVDNKLNSLHITDDLQASLFTRLKLKLDGLKVSIKNIEHFLDIASSVKPAVSLSKSSFVSLSKKPLARVNLSHTRLLKV
jgi:hypothetical protein